MPCFCHYYPDEESKRKIKQHCQEIINEVKRLEESGDPIGCDMKAVHMLLDHLYNPKLCDQNEQK